MKYIVIISLVLLLVYLYMHSQTAAASPATAATTSSATSSTSPTSNKIIAGTLSASVAKPVAVAVNAGSIMSELSSLGLTGSGSPAPVLEPTAAELKAALSPMALSILGTPLKYTTNTASYTLQTGSYPISQLGTVTESQLLAAVAAVNTYYVQWAKETIAEFSVDDSGYNSTYLDDLSANCKISGSSIITTVATSYHVANGKGIVGLDQQAQRGSISTNAPNGLGGSGAPSSS